jgi:hypothetical protein
MMGKSSLFRLGFACVFAWPAKGQAKQLVYNLPVI